jgi:hypothetical protein
MGVAKLLSEQQPGNYAKDTINGIHRRGEPKERPKRGKGQANLCGHRRAPQDLSHSLTHPRLGALNLTLTFIPDELLHRFHRPHRSERERRRG